MSTDSLALFRKSLGPELASLADEHYKHDLREEDRAALRTAASTVSVHTTVGSALGITLGLVVAFRLRKNRTAIFNALKTAEQPTAVKFASGREETIPDLTPLLRPSTIGDVATYSLLGAGGLFFGGETGLLTGTFRARQQIGQNRDSRDRIQAAFARFRADALRAQANNLEQNAEHYTGDYSL